MSDQQNIELEIMRISEMIEDILKAYKEDREIAKKNYELLKDQLEEIYESGMPMSEEGALEKSVNNALKIYIDVNKRLDKAFEIVSKMFNTQTNNHTKLLIADKIIDGNSKLDSPVDFKMLK